MSLTWLHSNTNNETLQFMSIPGSIVQKGCFKFVCDDSNDSNFIQYHQEQPTHCVKSILM